MKQSILLTLCGILLSFNAMANDTIRIYSNGCDDYQTFIGPHGSQLTMTATSDQWSHFVRWQDGNTDNPRTITTIGNADYTAYFETYKYSVQVKSDDAARGSAYISKVVKESTIDYHESVGTFDAGSEVFLAYQANYGYHFAKWSDGNTSQQRSFILAKDTTFTATFAKDVYSITKNAAHGSVSGNNSAEYLDFVTLTVTPDYGYHFTQWSDGLKDNPRIFQITKDTAFTAEFAVDKSGKCGDNLALTWTYDGKEKALTISGSGTLNSNYTFGVEAPTLAEKLIIAEGVTSIGNSAFAGYSTLKHVSIAASVKTIYERAFYNCTGLQEIYSYRDKPSNAYSDTFDGIDKSECTLYVLSSAIELYGKATGWRDFYLVETIDAEEVKEQITDVAVEPTANTAEVTWPVEEQAATYTLQISKNGEVFCTLIFNANGQLTGIAFAPGKNGSHHAPAAVKTSNGGLRFTVTGLESSTNYHLTLDAKDSGNQVIATYTSNFTTTGVATGIDEIANDKSPNRKSSNRKLLIGGHIFILRGDKTYTLTGQEIK